MKHDHVIRITQWWHGADCWDISAKSVTRHVSCQLSVVSYFGRVATYDRVLWLNFLLLWSKLNGRLRHAHSARHFFHRQQVVKISSIFFSTQWCSLVTCVIVVCDIIPELRISTAIRQSIFVSVAAASWENSRNVSNNFSWVWSKLVHYCKKEEPVPEAGIGLVVKGKCVAQRIKVWCDDDLSLGRRKQKAFHPSPVL